MARLDAGDLLAAVHLAVVVTALAFVLWYSAVRRLGAGRAGLLHRRRAGDRGRRRGAARRPGPAATVWLGTAVVVAGLVIAFGARPRRAPRPRARP